MIIGEDGDSLNLISWASPHREKKRFEIKALELKAVRFTGFGISSHLIIRAKVKYFNEVLRNI